MRHNDQYRDEPQPKISGNKSTEAINPYQDIEDILYNYTVKFIQTTDLANHSTREDIKQHIREYMRENRTSLNVLLDRSHYLPSPESEEKRAR